MQYLTPQYFGKNGNLANLCIAFTDPSSQKPFMALGVDMLPDLHLVGAAAGTELLPRYRYADGHRLDNITDWALDQFRGHYGNNGITRDDIFAYVYGVLHDPVYREKYSLNLKREFPRIPFYAEFKRWRDWGQDLLDLHVGYESVEAFGLERIDIPDERARAAGVSPRVILKADPDNGIIVLDSETQLSAAPTSAWDYRLGNRSAIDWVLDQHREKTPKDPTIREKFNTYRFIDHKEQVINLLQRVITVSVRTQEITERMRASLHG